VLAENDGEPETVIVAELEQSSDVAPAQEEDNSNGTASNEEEVDKW
jgi:hypothetical protein